MSNNSYPQPPSHKTFTLGKVVIDSNFDSGNCCLAQKVNASTYAIWIATDHPKNIYRMWFYFSVEGISKGSLINFQIKNMQNQSKLLYDGLVPVVRDTATNEWKRISHKVNLSTIVRNSNMKIYNDNQIEWTFTHQFSSNQKHYFAIYYPWSNQDNQQFIQTVSDRAAEYKDVYFHRATIIHTLQGRPVEMLTITSTKGITQKQQNFDDNNLFVNSSRPKQFDCDKKCIVIAARVHPGQVPGSHVMSGIIDQLSKDNKMAQILREQFIFYIFPILNPDGVGRGHFRVDTNGINLNRCYINPSPREHSSIYAVKRVIMHTHGENKYFAFLDLHAQASRKGNFIYGNSINQLNKQIDACLFAKILSLNSENFQYEGSNFMEKHMYLKDKSDHISKEGCGRVAVYYATKNPNSWTLQCSYHMSQRVNVLEDKKQQGQQIIKIDQENLDKNIIKNYKIFPFKEADQAYTIKTYRELGKQILESLLDFVEMNPTSRISNPNNYFKNVANVKLSLAIALIKMAPNRFQPYFRKVFFMLQTENEKIINRCFKALYYMIVKKASIPKLAQFLRDQDNTILYPLQRFKNFKKVSRHTHKPNFSNNHVRLQAKIDEDNFIELHSTNSIAATTIDQSPQKLNSSPQSCYSQLLSNKKSNQKEVKNPVIKIIEIDKQIHLKESVKQSIKMFGINQIQSKLDIQPRYDYSGQATTFGDYNKRKEKVKNESSSMRKTYNEVFKLQILPKLLTNQKIGINNGINSSVFLKHHKSLK